MDTSDAVDRWRQNADHWRQQRDKMADDLRAAREAMRTTAKGAVTVDGGILLRMLLSTALIPADNAALGQARVLCKKIAPVPVRVEIAGGQVAIADPGGKWSRTLSAQATAAELPAPAEPAPAEPAPAPAELPAPAPAPAEDTELCALCSELAGQPLPDRAACLAWLREMAHRKAAAQEAQAQAPGLRLVHSAPAAPKVPGVREPRAARAAQRAGKLRKASAFRPTRAQIEAAGNWDW